MGLRAHSKARAIRIIYWVKFTVAKAKVFPNLKAWVCVGRGILRVKGYSTPLVFERINKFKKKDATLKTKK
jgi:hypothetical protein